MKWLWTIGACCFAALTAPAQAAAPFSPAGNQSVAPASQQPNIHPAVARIVAPGNGSISYGSGTLVYVNEQYGLVVTNWHVINEATGQISVHFADGFYSLGTVQRADRDWDLALIAIRRPHVQPVPLADAAPKPGEMLTIAGYGSGNYRAASGVCTQYVAPGTTFPYEMVEVAVSARQGDSGGPIFNSRGELAGVLFGEGQGRTSGSYCGRVRWFLSSVVPTMSNSNSLIAAAPLRPVSPPPSARQTRPEVALAALPASSPSRIPARALTQSTVPSPAGSAPVVASTHGPPAQVSEVQYLGWEDVAGKTLGEQLKTVLAGIGGLAVLLNVLRWLGQESAES